MKKALIQTGYAIFGIADSVNSLLAEYNDELQPGGGCDDPITEDDIVPSFRANDGDLVIEDCSDILAELVWRYGGDLAYDIIDGVALPCGDELAEVWDTEVAAGQRVYRVMTWDSDDGEPGNAFDARVLQTREGHWLYVDDVDGYEWAAQDTIDYWRSSKGDTCLEAEEKVTDRLPNKPESLIK